MKLITFALCSAILTSSCVSASILESNICDTVVLNAQSSTNKSVLKFTSSFDFSSTVNKINDITNQIIINVNKFTIDNVNDLNWITKADIFISNENTIPVPFASYNANNNIKIDMDSNTMLKYFSLPIIITVIISGNAPANDLNFKNTMCIEVNGVFNKNI